MPRRSRKSVSQHERQHWLDQLERGTGITEVAKRAGRDIRGVKRHIDIARSDRTLADANRDFVRSRIELHQEDLLNEAHRIRDLLSKPRVLTLKPEDNLQAKLHGALLGHTRGPLSRLVSAWETKRDHYGSARDRLAKVLTTHETKIKSHLDPDTKTNEWTKWIVSDQEDALRTGTTSPLEYEKEGASGAAGFKITWRARELTKHAVNESQRQLIVEAHSELVSEARQSFAELKPLRDELSRIADDAIDEIEVLILRRLAPGRCRLCPS